MDRPPGPLNITRTSTAAASTNRPVALGRAQSLTGPGGLPRGRGRQSGGTPLAIAEVALRVLEARFHPRQKSGGDFIVVGHVVWEGEGGHPVVQPSSTLLTRGEPATLLSKLQYLVSINGRESF